MVKDDHEHREPNSLGGSTEPCCIMMRKPAWPVVGVAVAAALISSAAVFYGLQTPVSAPSDGGAVPAKAALLFRDWPTDKNPEVVLVLSGQAFGYMQPCGCSKPQLGGLERRYNFIESLKQRGWPVVAVDLGDVAQRSGPQSLLKYGYSMRALQKMEYSAVGIGENELAMPLMDALAQFTLQNEDK